jgi:hypothetical protein
VAPVISVCCPTRGRPDNMRRLAESATTTAAGQVEVMFYVDVDDQPSIDMAVKLNGSAAMAAAEWGWRAAVYPNVQYVIGERIVLSDMWNACAAAAAGDILMQCGDDIVFRTPGWDAAVTAEFDARPDRVLLVHGNDGVHGPGLGTHGFVHRAWVDAVGYFLPPGFSCDMSDVWLNEVANELGRRVYLPQVFTEHMHPIVGKASLDQTHRDRLAAGRRDNVHALYAARADERSADVAKLRHVIEGGG